MPPSSGESLESVHLSSSRKARACEPSTFPSRAAEGTKGTVTSRPSVNSVLHFASDRSLSLRHRRGAYHTSDMPLSNRAALGRDGRVGSDLRTVEAMMTELRPTWPRRAAATARCTLLPPLGDIARGGLRKYSDFIYYACGSARCRGPLAGGRRARARGVSRGPPDRPRRPPCGGSFPTTPSCRSTCRPRRSRPGKSRRRVSAPPAAGTHRRSAVRPGAVPPPPGGGGCRRAVNGRSC